MHMVRRVTQREEDEQPIPLSERPVERRSYEVMKRILDIFASLTGLFCIAPVLLIIAIAIKLDSPGPILSGETRIGRLGKPFRLYRLRTKHVSPPKATGTEAEAWAYKAGYDVRVTRLGRILRMAALDELPQLVNVLKGEMSLVGPRPAFPFELTWPDGSRAVRMQVQPGITGLWQVVARNYDYERLERADFEYFRRRSFWLDLKILLKTVRVVFQARGR